jgi:hypothetical protein
MKKVSSSLETNRGITLAIFETHFYPPMSTSSPSIASEDIPEEGDVAEEIITLRIPVK